MGKINNIPLDLVNSSERDSISQSNTKLPSVTIVLVQTALSATTTSSPRSLLMPGMWKARRELQRIETKEIKRAFHNDSQDMANSNFSFFLFPSLSVQLLVTESSFAPIFPLRQPRIPLDEWRADPLVQL